MEARVVVAVQMQSCTLAYMSLVFCERRQSGDEVQGEEEKAHDASCSVAQGLPETSRLVVTSSPSSW